MPMEEILISNFVEKDLFFNLSGSNFQKNKYIFGCYFSYVEIYLVFIK